MFIIHTIKTQSAKLIVDLVTTAAFRHKHTHSIPLHVVVSFCHVRYSLHLFLNLRPCVFQTYSFRTNDVLSAFGFRARNRCKLKSLNSFFYLQEPITFAYVFFDTHSIVWHYRSTLVRMKRLSYFIFFFLLLYFTGTLVHIIICSKKAHNRFSHVNEHRSELVLQKKKKKYYESVAIQFKQHKIFICW